MAIHCLNSVSALSTVTVTAVSPYSIMSQNCFKLGSFLSISFRLGDCSSIPAGQWTKVATQPFTLNSTLGTGGIGYRSNYEAMSMRFDTNGNINVWPSYTGYTEMYFWASLLIV